MIRVILDATDTILPVPVKGLCEFGRGKLETQGHGEESGNSSTISRRINLSLYNKFRVLNLA
jgi:hypothetical protein